MNSINKKRKSQDEEADDITKRIKLDTLFDELSISDTRRSFIQQKERSVKPTYLINPNFTSGVYSIKKPQVQQATVSTSHLDTFLSQRLNEHLQQMINTQLSIIPWYDYRFLIVLRFHKWIVRLFNRFVKQYNQRNQLNIPRFKNFDSILKLCKDNVLTLSQLFEIVLQENQIELNELQVKFEMRESREKQQENNMFRDVRYNYWDNLKLSNSYDFDMVEVGDNAKVFEVDSSYESDVDMTETDATTFNESDYSSFYTRTGPV